MSDVFQRVRAQGSAPSLVTRLETRLRRRRKRARLASGALALVVIFSGGTWFHAQLNAPAERAPVSAALFEPIQRLPDGSIVELKQGAELAVKYEPAFRRVNLIRGEALFRVEKDPARPFIVTVGGIEVRAVGTAFNVKLDSSQVEVLVTEGKVRVDDAKHGASLLPRSVQETATQVEPVLSVGQRIVVELPTVTGDQSIAHVATLAPEEIARQLAWRVPRLEFDGTALADAVAQMNRQSRVQIVLASDELANFRLSGSFSPDDPEAFVRLVAATFELSVQHRGAAEIVLSRNER